MKHYFNRKERDVCMTDQRIYELVSMFKSAMLAAQNEGIFEGDDVFCRFPRGCCGDTCYLLATFLKSHGIETIYVWSDYGRQSHAWLVVNDGRVKVPMLRYINVEDEYVQLVSRYGGKINRQIEDNSYRARDLTKGLVIDITADQFGGPSVYVGARDAFYRRFTFQQAHICKGVSDKRLGDLYRNISWFLPKQH